MNKLTQVLIILLISITSASAQFVEIFRSEPGRKPPKGGFQLGDTSNWPTGSSWLVRDLNSNGAPDFTNILNDTILNVIDGKTKQNIVSGPIQLPTDKNLSFVGFLKFLENNDTPYSATHVVIETEAENPTISAYNCERWHFADPWQMQNTKLVAIDDMDEDGYPEMVLYDITNRQIVVVGWSDATGHTDLPGLIGSDNNAYQKITEFEIFKASAAYQLAKKFESAPGLHLAVDQSLLANTKDLDYNDDGVMEIVMLEEDDDGNIIGMRVRNGATHVLRWSFLFPESGLELEDILRGFWGFFDVNGDGEKEAVFGKRTVVTLDKVIHTLDDNFETIAIYDLDGDQAPELVGRGVQDSTVQIWGRPGNTTGISVENLAVAGFQLRQNYPNPFNPSTSINFSLPVTGQVELKIYNALGRQVRGLVNESKTAGDYTIEWDGRNDAGMQVASGTYFYRLKINESQITRQMVLVK